MFLMNCLLSYSQNTDYESIIHLDEVLITEKIVVNSKRIKTKGRDNASFSITGNSTFLTLVDEIPAGNLGSVKFFFNNRKKEEYADRMFELVIFKKGLDGLPGEKLITENLHFKISKEHRGEIEISLKNLNLRTYKELYFGLKLLNGDENSSGFSIDSNHNKKSSVYFLIEGSDGWIEVPGINFNLELKVYNTKI